MGQKRHSDHRSEQKSQIFLNCSVSRPSSSAAEALEFRFLPLRPRPRLQNSLLGARSLLARKESRLLDCRKGGMMVTVAVAHRGRVVVACLDSPA